MIGSNCPLLALGAQIPGNKSSASPSYFPLTETEHLTKSASEKACSGSRFEGSCGIEAREAGEESDLQPHPGARGDSWLSSPFCFVQDPSLWNGVPPHLG